MSVTPAAAAGLVLQINGTTVRCEGLDLEKIVARKANAMGSGDAATRNFWFGCEGTVDWTAIDQEGIAFCDNLLATKAGAQAFVIWDNSGTISFSRTYGSATIEAGAGPKGGEGNTLLKKTYKAEPTTVWYNLFSGSNITSPAYAVQQFGGGFV